MRVAYLDCFAGISGDMFVAAAVQAGVPLEVLEEAVAALSLDASLRTEIVDRSGISALKVHVFEGDQLAEAKEQAHPHDHKHDHAHDHPQKHQKDHKHDHDHDHAHQHDGEHEHGHEHKQEHGHTHGRSLSVIRKLITAAPLSEAVQQRAVRIFEALGAAEAKIHNVPIESIHFHEVGAVDAIVDIVAASATIEYLEQSGPVRWCASPINVGGGMVECAHGTFPVPAPATADLLRDFPTYSAHLQKELVTPTGAAILRILNPEFVSQPLMRVQSIGYGAGTRNPKGFPNVLRLSIGDLETEKIHDDEVVVIETALDDLNPQIVAHAAQLALASGALDVMLTPVVMKKGRPGTLLTLLAHPRDAARMEALLFCETSTLGLRTRREHRRCLERRHEVVETPYGEIRIKLGLRQGAVLNAAAEFEDCREAAEANGVALKTVYQAALSAWAAKTARISGVKK